MNLKNIRPIMITALSGCVPALFLGLSGCVASHPSKTPSAQPDSGVKQYRMARAEIHAQDVKISARIHAEETKAGTLSTFQRVVWHLQSLGYLPITHAVIHEQSGVLRHDAFLWPIPAALQHAADQYAWNAQDPFIRGAVIQFERTNGILGAKGVSEGNLHKNVVHAILSDSAKPTPYPWEWVYVTKSAGTKLPERLHVWQHGKGWIWHTRVNTGVLGSTPNGTWPIYQRLPSTTMRGTFPVPVSWSTYSSLKDQQVPQWAGSALMQSAVGTVNGHPVRWQPYNDPGILWVNYFDDGRGIHYYPRASYGFPQSAGCVEEPYKAAPITYRILHYGVPVTVSRAVFHAPRKPIAPTQDR